MNSTADSFPDGCNGWFPNYGCSKYTVQDGDVINWVYTCNLGKDVGDNSMY
jgi:hypothetical protein